MNIGRRHGIIPATEIDRPGVACCVGINRYRARPKTRKPARVLKGAVNDAEAWKGLLRKVFGFKVKPLRDEEATLEKVQIAIKQLVKRANEGHPAVFAFSGHGTQVEDVDGDECGDDWDEALVLHDGLLVDDRIGALLGALDPGARFTAIFDACHTGSGTRLTWRRALRQLTRSADPLRQNMNHILLAAAAAEQEAKEYFAQDEDRWMGALSYYAIGSARSGPGQSYAQWHKSILKEFELLKDWYPQVPQLEGPQAATQRRIFS